jgi:molybdopterin/thiamine biosynthesis adenylyltransferase/rhodanese-related sulfurtransferase
MPKSFSDLMREARATIREVTPAEAELLAERGARLIDVRENSEWEEGHIPGATHISKSYLEQQIEGLVPDRGSQVVLYCAGGVRSLFAAQTLRSMGYADVASMSGGFQAWKSEGRDWAKPVVLTREQKLRYSRHLLVPEVGAEGQAKLLSSRALFIGAGGLGSPAMLYLAAAGVGTLGIVDFDVVDLSNLQRQVIHTTDRVGRKKVESAAESVHALNPEITVVPHEEMLTEANVERIIAGYDVILDGTDTFETRYTLNDAAVRAGIPVVHASVFRFEGQLTVFQPREGPCYRCLYPAPPPPELAPGCSVAGVLGVVPGTMGLLQATEALKVLLGIGETLAGRLLIYDALDATFSELQLRRDPHCPACGDGQPVAAPSGVFTLGGGASFTTGGIPA